MFWRKKKDRVKVLRVIRKNTLKIVMRDGVVKEWKLPWVPPWSAGNMVTPWIRFYKWFFGRKGEFYVMRFKDGQTMIRRDDIVRFMVSIEEKAIEGGLDG